MIRLVSNKNIELSNYLISEGLSYNKIKALFRKKDIKINGERTKEDVMLKVGDEILLYIDKNFFNITTIYEDENIIIVDKPKKIEVVSEDKIINLRNIINPNLYAVHRLDFNTEGMVVFAKTETIKTELDFAFKNNLVEKEYITIVKNKPQKSEMLFVDYLEKFDGKVKIYSENKKNTKIIKTKINVLKSKGDYTLLKINLITGRTHQIRAHLSFYNLPVLGDEKYGDFKLNKLLNIHTQVLKCIKLKFNFNDNSPLNYLKDKEFVNDYDKILEIYNKI